MCGEKQEFFCHFYFTPTQSCNVLMADFCLKIVLWFGAQVIDVVYHSCKKSTYMLSWQSLYFKFKAN